MTRRNEEGGRIFLPSDPSNKHVDHCCPCASLPDTLSITLENIKRQFPVKLHGYVGLDIMTLNHGRKNNPYIPVKYCFPPTTKIVPACQVSGGGFDKDCRIHISSQMICISISTSWFLLVSTVIYVISHPLSLFSPLSYLESLFSLSQSPFGLSVGWHCYGVNY